MPDERQTHRVTLGCGTLILIALIVLFFSRPGVEDLQRDVRSLHSEVTELRRAVEAQTNEIRKLQEKLGAAQGAR
jgi:type II secretory pathway component PulM